MAQRTFKFGKFAKRKNSTLTPTNVQLASFVDCSVLFKNPSSLDNPTLTLKYNTSDDFEYNYAVYTNDNSITSYYFVRDKVCRNNDLWEVTLELDVMATHKTEILSSTQYVSYSQTSGGNFLPDTRIPILRNASVSSSEKTIDLLNSSGCYIFAAVGQNGVDVFRISRGDIQAIISGLQTWTNAAKDLILSALNDLDPADASIEEIQYELAKINANTGFYGNSYEVAVQCIRSCHWVPFSSVLVGGTSTEVYLGNYPTGKTGYKLSDSCITGNIVISIPWSNNDWRRVYCETAYLYLPFVGLVSLNTDDLAQSNSLYIKYSATPSDGSICYEVQAQGTDSHGDPAIGQVIGTYGGSCAMQIPIGINQQTSLGGIFNTLMQGTEKTISAALQGASSVNPMGIVAGAVATAFEVGNTTYNVTNAALSTTVSTVGGIGGGSGAGLDLKAKCYTVSRGTACTPAEMANTMGRPTMKPLQLSTITNGYIQCANAHVAADADAPIIEKIDYYLNNGFYKE